MSAISYFNGLVRPQTLSSARIANASRRAAAFVRPDADALDLVGVALVRVAELLLAEVRHAA